MILLSGDGATTDLIDVGVGDLSKAPRIKPLPDGLPTAKHAPFDGEWHGKGGDVLRTGTFLPWPLDQEYYRRLRACERLPDAFQVQLDGLRDTCLADSEGRVAATEARCFAQRLRDQRDRIVPVQGWKGWQVALLVTAAGVVASSVTGVIMRATQ